MVVVMATDATVSDVDHVVSVVRDAGGEAFVSRGESRTIIGLSGDIERFTATLNLAGLPGVADVVRISVPYKLVSREHRRQRSVILPLSVSGAICAITVFGSASGNPFIADSSIASSRNSESAPDDFAIDLTGLYVVAR